MQDTLARRLAHGPLAPVQALKYAAEIAAVLRELHRSQRVHGSIHPELIRVGTSGLMLSAPVEPSGGLCLTDDIAGLGAVLFEMLTARKPGALNGRSKPQGVTGLHAAGLQLAERCMAATAEAGPDIQKVSTEVRLLLLLARLRTDPQLMELPQPVPPPEAALHVSPQILPHEAPAPALELPGQAPMMVPLEPELPPTGSRCPKCQGYHVHRSKPRNAIERMMDNLGFSPRRCHRCYYRFVDIYGMRASIAR